MNPRTPRHLSAPAPTGIDRDLHLCRQCGSPFVQPSWWDETSNGAWRVELRCPECEHRREGIYPQSVVDAYDEHLNDGAEELARIRDRVAYDNLIAEIERFVTALRAGAILPEDF